MKSIASIDCKICHSRGHSLFCDLNDEKLTYLKDHKVTKIYKKHEPIFHEGETPHGLFCMFSGMVKVFKTADNGKEQIIRLSKESDILGYRSFFSGENYAASAQAISECTICFIEKEGIEKLIQNSPDIIYSLLKKMCRELGQSEERYQDLLTKSVEARLAYFLELLTKGSAGKPVELPLSRDEIASLVGARSETVIRILSKWKSEGLIELKAKNISISDPKHLFSTKN
ncbi:MAG: hypothetical protein A3B70_04065 [Deltaproteobacteria bacterium RIFCSPHIGHO2_02_FULL_40_11]|nr:MAG: hypothetical protein A3B70_04065 [Deltaproteobacteria bacterium RIFCSPHIGHO2_02_FULL_40_11]